MPNDSYSDDALTINDASEREWEEARSYFLKRRSVLLFTYYRAWETYPRSIQNLIRALCRSGVQVFHYDGMGLSSYEREIDDQPENLTVTQLRRLPLRRFGAVEAVNAKLQRKLVEETLRSLPGNPVVWVHGGFPEKALEGIDIDVFSFSDDLYRHSVDSPFVKKARLVTSHVPNAAELLGTTRAIRFVPPSCFISPQTFSPTSWLRLPDKFPKLVLGYCGSCLSSYLDYELLEEMLFAKDVGVLLVGRIDLESRERLEMLERYPNFHFEPWVKRSLLHHPYQLITHLILPYRKNDSQHGAFPMKVVEASYFGKPVLSLPSNKTRSLAAFYPDELIPSLLSPSYLTEIQEKTRSREAFKHFYYEMNPLHQLSVLAGELSC